MPRATADDLHSLAGRRFRLAGTLLRGVAQRPLDSIGLVAIAAAAGTILVNALHLQHGAHPAPILSAKAGAGAPVETTGSLVVMPRPRPPTAGVAKDAAAAPRSRAQIVGDVQRELSRRGFYDGAVDGIPGPKLEAAIREFEQAAGLKPTGDPTEALIGAIMRAAVKSPPERTRPVQPAAAAARRQEAVAEAAATLSARVAAIQRALADFGYGQIKPNGVLDGGTQSAIEKFERERKLPVTGQISDRLARELSALTGRPLE